MTLKQWRDVRGLTLESVASELGVSVTTLRSWESGETIPKVNYAYFIANIYDTHIDNIIFYQ